MLFYTACIPCIILVFSTHHDKFYFILFYFFDRQKRIAIHYTKPVFWEYTRGPKKPEEVRNKRGKRATCFQEVDDKPCATLEELKSGKLQPEEILSLPIFKVLGCV